VTHIIKHIDNWGYDFETDTFFITDKNVKYHSSVDMGDLFLELDDNGYLIGMELINASINFGIPKIKLHNIKNINADVKITETDITASINISVIYRNSKVEKVSISRSVNDMNLQPAQTAMVC
jgi:uncharacterized protein YuzE